MYALLAIASLYACRSGQYSYNENDAIVTTVDLVNVENDQVKGMIDLHEFQVLK